jgi:hypothetical protein
MLKDVINCFFKKKNRLEIKKKKRNEKKKTLF